MSPPAASVERLRKALRLDTPLIALYDCPPSEDFGKLVRASGRSCCFAYYKRWLKGETLVIERDQGGFSDPQNGCPGAQNAFGLGRGYPPYMAHFLTDGEGAPMGEGLKATPSLAQSFLDRARPPRPSSNTLLLGPLRLERWENIRSLSFLVDPDRLSALMTLAAYWSSDPELILATFSSGCGLLWRELENSNRERAVIGGTDFAMRKYLPADILIFSVTPPLLEKMLTYPEESFLNKSWWNDLMKIRGRSR
ncbi:MAG: DUF169 domain-containing protein [Candidatus Krumholzibacteriota bacterium]|nr:DUF169 domain-containing protein [Candidatus Krumholzibacteriota bacterium]